MAASTARWQLLAVAGEVKKQASWFLQDKYKQARLALGDVTPAELLVQEATNNDACLPDARTLACIADAAFDMDDCWRIAKVLHQRLRQGSVDWKEWRPVYKALVVLEFLLTHGPEDLPREFVPDMPSINHLRSFNYIDDKGFNWGSCMQRRTDSILTLLTDGDRLKDARRRRVELVQHGGSGSPTSSSSPSSATSSSSRSPRTWSSFGSHYSSDSPTTMSMCFAAACNNSSDADYRHDKKFDAYTADDDVCWTTNKTTGDHDGGDHQLVVVDDASWDAASSSWSSDSSRFYSTTTTIRSLSQPERRKLQRQI